ncbi:Asp23/Gls24 family envelope stress response protein [Enterococcus faecalis]|nr:Asp23/Gls24 family envelope stress response protein [Enterococcus faecalis]EKZ0408983.1 Asp23/Gls24 family envelope stress response protein [Enterococcus faecalis]HAP4416070.1 Asp23/Gls24 family envelope stress response protein [Enterococcus faecalis]HAP4419081.1 Asp23/Gls24 family envelope stress response protein [Enterococcus faecalis]
MLKPIESVKGELVFEDKVIQKIIGIALDEIDGLLTIDGGFFSNIAGKLVNTDNTTSGVDVEVGKKQVAADLSIVAEYGKDVTSIYEKMKQVISEEVKKMTGLDVIEVNVNVVDVKTKEQYEKDSVTMQDHLTDAASATGEFTSKQAEKVKEALGVASEKVNNGVQNVKENVEESKEPRVQ